MGHDNERQQPRPRRKFSDEFKRDAVDLVLVVVRLDSPRLLEALVVALQNRNSLVVGDEALLRGLIGFTPAQRTTSRCRRAHGNDFTRAAFESAWYARNKNEWYGLG